MLTAVFEFPKSRRLRKRREFVRAQGAARAARVKHALLLLHRRGDDGPLRLGVVASKRVGNAVRRNRGKRLVREWFRHLDSPLKGCDVVVVLRASAPDCTAAELAEQLSAALGQAAARLR